jgi:membrane-associated phospholipid phosphatase
MLQPHFSLSLSQKVPSLIQKSLKFSYFGCLVLGAASAVAGTPTLQGQSGYINMPNASVEPDGTFSFGYGYDKPYGSFWATATVLPFLQVTGRYVSINGIQGFTGESGQYGSNYGRYKDKIADAKLRLWNESAWLPSVAIGATDLLGTELFKGRYVVATKSFGFGSLKNIEASVGYGNQRPDGLFAAARWYSLDVRGLAVVAEYDANDYQKDFRADQTFAGERRKGPSVGLEYRWGWLGAQVARQREHFSANIYMSIPFSEREFLPKISEPAYFQPKDAPARVSGAEWQGQPEHVQALVEALAKQDFKNIRVRYEHGVLKLTLTNTRISNLGRAVGRATRTALAFSPQGSRQIQVTYTKLEQPIATYEMADLPVLTDYLTGLVDRQRFLKTVTVRYAKPSDQVADREGMLASIKEDGGVSVDVGRDGDMIQVRSEDREANRFKLMPKLGFFFNDPSGALRYEVAAGATYDKRLGQGTYLNSDFKLNLVENVSGVTQSSNSLLPHVRTDIAEYKRGDRFKLNKLLINQYLNPSERVYARVSGGFYEEMYRGFGGQVLYLPKDTRWAADVAVDALQQRGFKGWLDKRGYQTVTALGALHYRLPYDITVTGRAGRFLARDTGARIEFKRRFQSGIEIGAWYTRTNGQDITSPGSPQSPYHDKGIFLSVPLNTMLVSDTQASASMAISPWTRDVGQMVQSPGDLYGMIEKPRRDLSTYDGLGNFAERADEQNMAAVNPPVRAVQNPWPAFRMRVEQASSAVPTAPEWMQGSFFAGAAVLGGLALDKSVDRFMKRHQDESAVRPWGNVAKAMPVALAGLSAAAITFGDERAQNVGVISLESILVAAGVSVASKHVANRARPNEELGRWAQSSSGRSDSSFPSNHSAVAFAAVTPFAKEYNAPWMYGVVALASMGRTANRQHWTSDVVGGGVIGYAIGSWLWEAQRDNSKSRLSIAPGPKEISVAWSKSY